MRTPGFISGLGFGVLLGAAGTWLATSGATDATPQVQPRAPRTTTSDETAGPGLLGTPPASGHDAAAPPDGSTSAVPRAAATDVAAGADAAAAEVTDAEAVRLRKVALWSRLKTELQALEGEVPGSAAVAGALDRWRALAQGEDALAAEVAGKALVLLARRGLLGPEDVTALREAYEALPAGAAGRPALAATVARAWARDERLARWIADLPQPQEPAVREWVLWSLDETPSAAYRDWVLHLSANERRAEVLDTVWNEDIVIVNLTRDNAAAFATSIETRIGWGDLPVVTRARGYFALGLIAQHVPVDARRSLADLLTREAQVGALAFGRGVLAAIDRNESNLQALEGLWDQHEASFAP